MGTADEHLEQAEEFLKQAETLAGRGTMSDREFLESMSRADSLIDHEDNCGQCHHQVCMAEAARELLAEGEILDGIAKWSALAKQKWQDSKYFKLYQQEQAAGRSPQAAFDERGWEM